MDFEVPWLWNEGYIRSPNLLCGLHRICSAYSNTFAPASTCQDQQSVLLDSKTFATCEVSGVAYDDIPPVAGLPGDPFEEMSWAPEGWSKYSYWVFNCIIGN